MSDELEPFRRAAELGCPDFEIMDDKVLFPLGDQSGFSAFLPMLCECTQREQRINRYAAAVCAEWWRDLKNDSSALIRSDIHPSDYDEMIDLCRAFGRKHGAE